MQKATIKHYDGTTSEATVEIVSKHRVSTPFGTFIFVADSQEFESVIYPKLTLTLMTPATAKVDITDRYSTPKPFVVKTTPEEKTQIRLDSDGKDGGETKTVFRQALFAAKGDKLTIITENPMVAMNVVICENKAGTRHSVQTNQIDF